VSVDKLIHENESYKIIGIVYDVYNEVGYGHKEKYYQNAVSIALKKEKITFQEQVYAQLKYKDVRIGKYFFDFLIDDKIVLELKVGSIYSKKNIEQVYSYLKVNNLKLGIIVNFTKNGVKVKRIVNIK